MTGWPGVLVLRRLFRVIHEEETVQPMRLYIYTFYTTDRHLPLIYSQSTGDAI